MAKRKNSRKEKLLALSQEEDGFIHSFEAEYGGLVYQEGLEAAKAFFRENFMVRCFGCGYLGKTVPP